MARLSALSTTLVGVLFLGLAGCGGTGKRIVPEAGVSGGGATPATGGQSGGGAVVVGSGGTAGSGGLPGTGAAAGRGGTTGTGGVTDGGVAGSSGLPGTDAAAGNGGTIGGAGATGSGGTTATGGVTDGDVAGSGGLPGTDAAAGNGGTIGGAGATGRGGTTATGGITGGATGTNTGTMADAGVDSGKDASPQPPDLAPDLGPPGPCTGKGDFTPCVVVTTPDRRYDICVAGVCVSPGCGDSTCNAPGPHFPLADTDERTCSNGSTGTIACPASGQAYYGQDAQYGWDTLHPESERFTRSLSVASQPLVLDNVTGLTWQGCAAGLTGSDCATGQFATYAWQDAVAYCDALDWGGYQDWHLPDPYELDSIVDAGPTGFDTTAFPAASKNGNFYWSSSSAANRSTDAWGALALPLARHGQESQANLFGAFGERRNRNQAVLPAIPRWQPSRWLSITSPGSHGRVVRKGFQVVTARPAFGGSLTGLMPSPTARGSRGAAVRTGVCPTGKNFARFGTTGCTIRQSTPAHFRPRLKATTTTTSGRRRVPGVCLGSPDNTCMGWDVEFQIGDASPNGSMSSSSMSGDSYYVRCVRGGP